MADICILGIPLDLGAGRRGVDMGPSALRLAGLAPTLERLGHTVADLGNDVAGDIYASAEYRRAMAPVFTRRALAAAAARA